MSVYLTRYGWKACLSYDYKTKHIGYYKTRAEAQAAYNKVKDDYDSGKLPDPALLPRKGLVTVDGRAQTVVAWANELGITRALLYSEKAEKGITMEEVIALRLHR